VAKIWKRKSRDTWTVDYRDASGVRRRLTAKSREEAENLLAEKFKESRQAAPPVRDPEITVSAYAEQWLEQTAPRVEPTTLASYGDNLRLHLLPEFGTMKVRALHRAHIKALLAHKLSDGLSKNTVRLIRATLSVMLGDAVEDGIILINPAQGIGRRGRRQADAISQSERQKKIRPLSHEQLATLLATARARSSRRDYTLFLTLADTGLRPGEALALRWEDVDDVARSLRIERAVSGGRVKATKTEETRIVDLTPRLAEALSQWQAEAEAQALMAGHDISPWVFPSDAGTPLDANRVAKRFRSLLRVAGLPHFRLYDLRHTYATDLLLPVPRSPTWPLS
jgi:integrase